MFKSECLNRKDILIGFVANRNAKVLVLLSSE